MNFDDLLALVALIFVILLLIIVNYKNIASKRKIEAKVIILILTLFLSLPFWYLIQFAVNFALARVIPENKNVNCIYLNETNCKKRPGCSVGYVDNIGGSSFCINK